MQEVIDAINSDHFGATTLTDSMMILPYKPGRLGEMNLFNESDPKANLRTTVVTVDEKFGKLRLIVPQARGTRNNKRARVNPKARRFGIPHFPEDTTIIADDLANIRPYGDQTMLEAVTTELNDRQEELKQDHEFTHEHLRVGALKGDMIDGNGETIYNWYDEFQLEQVTINVNVGGANPDSIKLAFHDVHRKIRFAAGNDRFTGFYGFCGRNFMDILSTAGEVETAYQRYLDGEVLRSGQAISLFQYANIDIEEYWGHVNNQPFFEDNAAYIFPTGTTNIFQRYNAPANFMETVNTKAKPYYAKRKMADYDTGVDIHTQSNALFLNKRPGCVIKVVLQDS